MRGLKEGPPGTRLLAVAAVVLIALLALPSVTARAQVSPEEAFKIGTDAYVYGYPLVTMEMTRRVMTNTVLPHHGRAPMGQFYHAKRYKDASFRGITAPNTDTLYSTAWLDLSREPYILSIPKVRGRYYVIALFDAWTNVFQAPGSRTTGTAAQTYAITGPGWSGKLPRGMKEFKSPTNLVWIFGRIYCTGTDKDLKAVHAIQRQLWLVPLSAYGKPYPPPDGKVDPGIDIKTPVRDQVNGMDASEFFKMMAVLMKDNPPAAADAPIIAEMAKIGIVPGQDFNINELGPGVAKALQRVTVAGQERIAAYHTQGGTSENGWKCFAKTGAYGTDYLPRATMAAFGLGANDPQDATYHVSKVDAEGKPYDGAKKYVLHFDKGRTPPAWGFWSLTMYDTDLFLVPNGLNRYTISSRFPLKYNPDGSLDLYIQKDSPGKDKETNWLPAPEGPFILMERIYWPKQSVVAGNWKTPGVKCNQPPAGK